jgi:uncharacterized protein DUF6602
MPPFDFKQLMAGTIRQLQTEADYFSSLTSHNPEKGRLNESHLVKTLRRYLPAKFGIGTGFIVSGGQQITLHMPEQLGSMLPVVDLSIQQLNADSVKPVTPFPYRPDHFDLVDVDHYAI